MTLIIFVMLIFAAAFVFGNYMSEGVSFKKLAISSWIVGMLFNSYIFVFGVSSVLFSAIFVGGTFLGYYIYLRKQSI
jgi:hypothetical protein